MGKKESHWFSHDANATDDPKIIALMNKWDGFAGYGRWWRVCELLRSQNGYKYNIKSKFGISSIASLLNFTSQQASEFIKDCIDEFELLKSDGEYIWSESLLNRMLRWDKRKENLSNRGKKGANKRWADENGNEIKKDGTSITFDATSIEENATSIKNGVQKMANETKLNNNTSSNEEVCHSFLSLPTLKKNALKDSMFVQTYFRWGLEIALLAKWLDAFHKRLEYDGRTLIQEIEYRRYFGNWLKNLKYRTDNPEEYSPNPAPPGMGKEKTDDWRKNVVNKDEINSKYGD